MRSASSLKTCRACGLNFAPILPACPRCPSHAELVSGILLELGARPGVLIDRINVLRAVPPGSRQPVRSAMDGTPDILLCWRGRFVGIECKSGGGRLSPPQRSYRDALVAAGGHHIVARDVAQVVAEVLALQPALRLDFDVALRELLRTVPRDRLDVADILGAIAGAA